MYILHLYIYTSLFLIKIAPGGFVIDETGNDRAKVCVFTAEKTHEDLHRHYEVMFKLIRRYKYLEKGFTEELQKVFNILKLYIYIYHIQ